MQWPILLVDSHNVPHGLANAVLLPYVLEAYGKTIHKKLAALAVAAGVATKETPVEEAASDFIQAIKDMKARFGIGDFIPEIQEGGYTETVPLCGQRSESSLSGSCTYGCRRTGKILLYADTWQPRACLKNYLSIYIYCFIWKGKCYDTGIHSGTYPKTT